MFVPAQWRLSPARLSHPLASSTAAGHVDDHSDDMQNHKLGEIVEAAWHDAGSPPEMVAALTAVPSARSIGEHVSPETAKALHEKFGVKALAQVAAVAALNETQMECVDSPAEVVAKLLANPKLCPPARAAVLKRFKARGRVPKAAQLEFVRRAAEVGFDLSWMSLTVILDAVFEGHNLSDEVLRRLGTDCNLDPVLLIRAALQLVQDKHGHARALRRSRLRPLLFALREFIDDRARDAVDRLFGSSYYGDSLDPALSTNPQLFVTKVLSRNSRYALRDPVFLLHKFGWGDIRDPDAALDPALITEIVRAADAGSTRAAEVAYLLGVPCSYEGELPLLLLSLLGSCPRRASKEMVLHVLHHVSKFNGYPVSWATMEKLIERFDVSLDELPWGEGVFQDPVEVAPSAEMSPRIVASALRSGGTYEIEPHVQWCAENGQMDDLMLKAPWGSLLTAYQSKVVRPLVESLITRRFEGSPESWVMFSNLGQDWSGTLEELLTMCMLPS